MPTTPNKCPDTHLEETCSTLKRIAGQFAPDSLEHRALEDAARALIFVSSREMLKCAYEHFRRDCGKSLTRAQKAVLKGNGIEI